MGPGDSPDLHAADTLHAGAGLCDESAVRVLVNEGPRYVRELIEWGVRFDRTPDGTLLFGLEAAHSVRRILHAGDATGREISRALWERVGALPTVRTVNHALVTDVIVEDGAWQASATSTSPAGGVWCAVSGCCSPPAARDRCSARRRTPLSPPATALRSRITPVRALRISSSCSSIRRR